VTEQRRLGDRYELSDVLGRGGMAEVHLGRDVRLGRSVAVKTLRTDLARDPTFQARFRREAQSAASLNHPAIVAVYDTGEDIVNGIALPYIVMEYVDGSTLRELLQSGRRLLPERALEITGGICRALDYSHRQGIVHRDIKPANVMLTRNGEVKVMDFGIARAVADTAATMTATSAVIGTAQYLSPEQARGERADARSDIYSTGCLLYELLTGRPPFVGDSPVSVAYQHVREDPVPPSQLDPEIPPVCDAIVLKALAKNPENRYQTAGEMREDIERALSGRPVMATPLLAAGAMSGGTATQRIAPVESTSVMGPPTTTGQRFPGAPPEPPRSRPWTWVLLIVGVLAVFALALWLGRSFFGDTTQQVRVPQVNGQPEETARQLLTDAGLATGTVTQEASDTIEAGLVIRSDPEQGQDADEGSTVDLVVSSGADTIAVPQDIVGRTEAEARQILQDAGLQAAPRSQQERSDEPAGQVIGSDPEPGTQLARGSAVTLIVSQGQVAVPNVQGLTQEEAEAQLTEAGFNVVVQTEANSAAAGRVIGQDPAPNTDAQPGSNVTITVSSGPPPPTTPPPTSPASASPSASPSDTDD
jgi:eukaryotic-like serine/threonine-protein kinase